MTKTISTTSNAHLDEFIRLYSSNVPFHDLTIKQLARCYAPTITFIDPAHRVEGLDALADYFANQAENAQNITFNIKRSDAIQSEAKLNAYVTWDMHFNHPKLNKGNHICVEGLSHLIIHEGSEGIDYHRDYFDLGAMVYEHIPLLGGITRKLKQRLSTT